MKKKVTAKEFNLFKSECLRYQKMLNLLDWCLTINQQDLGGKLAQCETRASSRCAVVSLCLEWPDETAAAIGVMPLAAHEMTHLFLATLTFLGECRYVTDSEIDLENERLAQVLERVLVKVKRD